MSKKTRTIVVIAAAVVVLVAFILPRIIARGDNPTMVRRGQNKTMPLLVSGQVVQPQLFKNIVQATGSLMANEEVELHSEVAGKVTQIQFKEGSRVNKGDLLVKINDADLQAQWQKAQYQKKLAEDKELRQHKQLEMQAISQEQYDIALSALNTIQADIELIQAQIAKTEIHAPFDGIIGLRYISLGSYITPDSRIANLLSINPIKIDITIPEKYASNVTPGNEVSFILQEAEQTYTGKIFAVEPKIDPDTRTLHLRAACPNPEGKLLPGSFAKVELVIAEIPNALLIPTEAVIPELGGKKVFISRNGKAEAHAVETGVRTNQQVQVTSGLSVGDTLITSGILQLRPDMAVKIAAAGRTVE